ncbi:PAS domain-containing sensor histidine kinase [Longimicrobium terrae]|uniref:histidine kinase n=1 Tax=Longimicrobium terrae TaxID=1639882 RepID=A0A841H5J1_9BACT|nr:PAS domain-containing hybrid sensor histidine kinase/response regulator [Longimicrobium terrae]MBB4638963.1 PAS domain S-box-containing protein [Longimicrobium terrae]MBB6073202.1 PAS domain S-box-containing protein [Longimicrobium terrae]NNC32343.1 PAS domain S-box protein [Longimicrobium terrae]
MTETAGAPEERRLDELLDHAPAGFASFMDDGTIVAANATFARMLGYAPGELDGRRIESVMGMGTRIFYQTHFFPLLRLHGGAEEIFLLLRHQDGQDVGVLANAARRERDGAWASDCVFMQVRERRKFEDELLRARRTAEQAQAAAEARSEELRHANELLEQQAMELELQHQQLQEQAFEMETQAEEMQAINNELLERSEELVRQRAAAEEANQAKSSFLAVMSHELRTPLNAIAGYVQLLEMGIHGPVTEPQLLALDRIGRSQQHLLRLINDVLNLARIESGRVEYMVENVPIPDLLASVAPMVEPQMAAKQLAFSVDVDAVAVRADRDKVQQIIINLLSNSIKFTPPGGRIAVTSSRRAEQPGVVFVRVTDTGIGIAHGKQAAMFEPFVQVDMSRTRRSEGTGLGLSISRDLARGMGGDLRVRSEEGVGSTFTLTLPAAD